MAVESTIYNFEAQYVAAQLADAGLLDLNAIFIRPDDGEGKALSREIADIRRAEAPTTCAILTNRQSHHRRALYQALQQNALARELLCLLEYEINRFRVKLALDELEFAAGVPLEERALYNWSAEFSLEHLAILTYYKPFALQIKADLNLGAQCLSALLEQPVSISPAPPREKAVPSNLLPALGSWQIGYNAILAGNKISECPCYRVTIGPLATPDILAFLPGSNHRRFVEHGLCALVLPDGSEWQIDLLAQNENFRLPDGKEGCFAGINTRLV